MGDEGHLRIRGAAADTGRALVQRKLAEQAFSRAAGAPLVPGNRVALLRNAEENYPAWLEAIRGARRYILFESYIFANDEVGQIFGDALIERAKAGVRIHLLYDWLGTSWGRRLWAALRAAGADVRCFNPPRFDSPLAWLIRDHRKMIVVDGDVGFVSGLCVSARWLGKPPKGIEPWRDTGISIRGPAVADLEEAFAQVWAEAGPPLAEEILHHDRPAVPVGDVAVRVVATMPRVAGLYRLDQLIASLARRRLWLTDAYFVGVAPYVQALRAAAQDGVDVRLLVPSASDIPILSLLGRAGYRPLLEGGVRVFEWNGSMLHAKTAVADDRWARVGSTNLNLASFLTNYELDVAVEDQDFATRMADMYEEDLRGATEIVLARHSVRRARPQGIQDVKDRPAARTLRSPRGSARRAAVGALSLSSAVGAAMTDRRVLGPAEGRLLVFAATILIGLGAVGFVWPWALAVPFAVASAWLGITLLIRALRLFSESRSKRASVKDVIPKPRRAKRERRSSKTTVAESPAPPPVELPAPPGQ